MKDDSKGLAEILKEQLALLSLVLLLTGTVYADAYYAQFGIRVVSLGFSASYLIYRAFTVVLYDPWISVPYLLSLLWFGLDEIAIRSRASLKPFRIVAAYTVLVLVIIFSYIFAFKAGIKHAKDDMYAETSSLAKIYSTQPPINGCAAGECRVLTTDSEKLYVIKPTARSSSSIPNVRILEKKTYDEIVLGTQ
jgi:hypothetical protein